MAGLGVTGRPGVCGRAGECSRNFSLLLKLSILGDDSCLDKGDPNRGVSLAFRFNSLTLASAGLAACGDDCIMGLLTDE